MGRDIKFRAWDNVKFKMYYVGESEDVSFSFDSNGITATDLIEHDWGFKKLEHLQYSQFTGLHDKNGIPIYEGDIVKTYSGEIGEIVFRNGMFQRKINNKWGQDLTYPVLIIGNIYENPELLEQTS